MIVCKKCKGPTEEKRVLKGRNGPWTAHICTSGCLNEDGYPLNTYPPKTRAQAPAPNPGQAQPQAPANSLAILSEILQVVKRIEHHLSMKNEPLEKAHREAQEETIF